MALHQCVGAAMGIAGFLVLVLVYYRNPGVSSAVGWHMLVKVQRLTGSAGRCPSGSSTPEAAARERFAPVLDAYLRRHEAAVALLDGPSPWDDPEAAASLRLVVVSPGSQVCAARCCVHHDVAPVASCVAASNQRQEGCA